MVANRVAHNFIDLTGVRFGKLLVVRQLPNIKRKVVAWLCRCDCGTEVSVRRCNLGISTNSCGCIKKARLIGINYGRYGSATEESAIKRVYKYYKESCKRKPREFKLSPEEVTHLIRQDCYYCNSGPLSYLQNGSMFLQYNGIDRVDNGLGYTLDNCVTCCKQCNYAKRAQTKEEFISWVVRLYKNLENKHVV